MGISVSLTGLIPDVYKRQPKFYALVEFPYPSGAGLHVGHPRSYTCLLYTSLLTAEMNRIAEGDDNFVAQQTELSQKLSAKRLEQVTRDVYKRQV